MKKLIRTFDIRLGSRLDFQPWWCDPLRTGNAGSQNGWKSSQVGQSINLFAKRSSTWPSPRAIVGRGNRTMGEGIFSRTRDNDFFFNLVYTVVVRSLLDHEDSSTSPKYLSPLCPSGYFACYVIVHASMRFKTLANFRYVFAA